MHFSLLCIQYLTDIVKESFSQVCLQSISKYRHPFTLHILTEKCASLRHHNSSMILNHFIPFIIFFVYSRYNFIYSIYFHDKRETSEQSMKNWIKLQHLLQVNWNTFPDTVCQNKISSSNQTLTKIAYNRRNHAKVKISKKIEQAWETISSGIV